MDTSERTANAALRAALIDYSKSPGKYQVGLRQPQPLFLGLREVLQIAVGRNGEAGSGGDMDSVQFRDAARFFVRTALLYPGADHYAVLGFDRAVVSADLKDRYRLMMRLLHPDFSGPGAGSWPADSAVRLNRAYDTLSSAVQRRLYDESLAQLHGVAGASGAGLRRPRAIINRPDGDTRKSHFKTMALVCALAGAALVLVILAGTGSPESVSLVQRIQVQPDPVQMAKQQSPLPNASPLLKSQAMLVPAPAAFVAPPPKPSAVAVTRAAPAAPDQRQPVAVRSPPSPRLNRSLSSTAQPFDAPEARPERVTAPAAEPKSEPLVTTVASVAALRAPAAPSVAAVVQPAPVPRPVPKPGPTLVEAQPLLSQLLQVMESGRGDRILNLLDAEARNRPSAQALSRQYEMLVDGARPVRVSHVELKAEPGDGRLLVVGYFRVLAGEQAIGAIGKRMVLRAEFASREGTVVLTGLSGGPVN